ncbi:HEPN/Toprim-associated domain-containing protein [Listeria monocytogenes]|uniref:HEPN/Toprim-associated domain-containing protein n=1 Tax=Listeria monocytogenes TaxID=1639 RepID=UPI0008744343|nr:HEPN/Toprim-associated domain-containing protein [Listeria monocytogenes]OFH51281.1 hypothetical protein BJN07_11585 [Listeria monocytogenes]
MGSYIQLMVNKTCIDWGKNNCFQKHSWLFPPNSKKTIQYDYGGNIVQNKEGYSANLAEVKFRLDNLGYSFAETRNKYIEQLNRWNRINKLKLPFEYLLDIVNHIDLNLISDNYIFNLNNNFDGFISYLCSIIERDDRFKKMNFLNKMEDFYNYYSLESFLKELLDVYIFLRLFCENEENLKYYLEWQYIDIIEGGWASYQDIEEFDKKEFIINHNKLYGRLQLHAIGEDSKYYYEKEFDNWLADKGLFRNNYYLKLLKYGNTKEIYTTLPVYIRNVIHHPENTNNTFSDDDLNFSITKMLEILSRI